MKEKNDTQNELLYFNSGTKFSNASWQLKQNQEPFSTMAYQYSFGYKQKTWLTVIQTYKGAFLSQRSEVAASLDSIAKLHQRDHLCKPLHSFLRLLVCNGCKIAAAVPDITSRYKAGGREVDITNGICCLYQEKQMPLQTLSYALLIRTMSNGHF